ncbi:MAG: prepilin-type N-terminal cleavage/methylation domain-containing protein [Lachnospiraceae bacterium]|nr:prepilin-type N-terminal cleavage/methylation domain-containing protein [Lachnospiraceae bacterium]
MRDNRGVTFVELIVCMAILSFVLVALVGMLSSNTAVFKSQKSNITVQDDAREVIDHVTDLISQAEYVEFSGYKLNSGIAPIAFDNRNIGSEGVPGCTHVWIKKPDGGASGSAFTDTDFSEIYYPDEIKIKYAVPFEKVKPDGTNRTVSGEDVDKLSTDECTVTLHFRTDGKKGYMYETIRYKYMTDLNTPGASGSYTSESSVNAIYTDNLNFAKTGVTEVTGTMVRFDWKNQSIKVTMDFAENGQGYTVEGMANIKNANVLYDK